MSPSPDVAAASARRLHRAAIARRVLDKSPDACAALDWPLLDAAPDWLALPEGALSLLARRAGAVLCAPVLRLWIDGARIAAARAALGDAFLQALLVRRDLPAVDLGSRPRLDSAERVATLLQAAGSGVLLATLAPGALRRAASDVLGPAIDLPLTPQAAQSLVDAARTLEDAS